MYVRTHAFGHSIITSFDLRRRAESGYCGIVERAENRMCGVWTVDCGLNKRQFHIAYIYYSVRLIERCVSVFK